MCGAGGDLIGYINCQQRYDVDSRTLLALPIRAIPLELSELGVEALR